MKNLKRLTAAVLFFIISAQTCAFAYIPEGFSKLHDYDSNTYSDVYPADRYYYYVGFAYEYGIMTGNGDYTFNPGGNITLAEAVTVAARINAILLRQLHQHRSGGRFLLLYVLVHAIFRLCGGAGDYQPQSIQRPL